MGTQTYIYFHSADLTQFLRLDLPGNNDTVTVIVPQQDVLLTEAKLPAKLNRERTKQALPFALEENLIDDVNELHFAMGSYNPDNSLPVAIVARKKMEAWMSFLKEKNLNPSVMIPAAMALPYIEGTWETCSHDGISFVRTNKFSGFSCDQHNLEMYLKLNLAKEKNAIQINQFELTPEKFLEKFAPTIQQPYINLLQGHYPPKRQTSQTKKIWQYAGYLAAAWIGLLFLGNVISFIILFYSASKIQSHIDQIYKKNFPAATAVVAPKQRMDEKLRQLTMAANKNNFLALLATVTKIVATTKNVQTQNLDFHDNELMLEVTANSFDNLDAFTNDLNQQGLSVKQQNAAASGSQVKATLFINAGAT